MCHNNCNAEIVYICHCVICKIPQVTNEAYLLNKIPVLEILAYFFKILVQNYIESHIFDGLFHLSSLIYMPIFMQFIN
jgi:hypothetical protein